MSLLRTCRTSRTPGLRSGADLPSNVSRCMRRNTITTIPQFHPPSAATLKVRFGTCGSAVCLKVMTLPCLLLCASACSECHINRSERRDAAGMSFPMSAGLRCYPSYWKTPTLCFCSECLCSVGPSTPHWQTTTNRHSCWCVTSLYICCRCSVIVLGDWACWVSICWVLKCLRSDML